jgi:hypothetical protein
MSHSTIQYSVTTIRHPEDALKYYSNAEDAVLYANDLIEEGFGLEIKMLRDNVWHAVSYSELVTLSEG